MGKGDFVLVNETPFQSVSSHSRRYGVMFNPSSSRSRLRVVDGGRRYSVRLLSDGTVEYSVDNDTTWHPIRPLADPCTGQVLPAFLSHNERRAGTALTAVPFDMIAVGRGRIIAKEAGSDRLFHTVMDELFRTYHVSGPDCEAPDTSEVRIEDPPVPGVYMKLDPEYFLDDSPSLTVPPEAKRDYSGHPASLRLPVFAQLLELQIADVMLVMQRARTWYLVDPRSPRSIVGPEDLRFTEADFKAVFTEKAVADILKGAAEAFGFSASNELRQWIEAELRGLFPEVNLDDLRQSLGPLTDFLTDAIQEVLKWLSDIVSPWLAQETASSLPNVLIDWLARETAKSIQEEGYGALVFPAYVALGFVLYSGRSSGAVRGDPDGVLRLNPGLWTDKFPENRALSNAIAELMLRSRRRAVDKDRSSWPAGMPTPNQPPSWVPTYLQLRYQPRRSGGPIPDPDPDLPPEDFEVSSPSEHGLSSTDENPIDEISGNSAPGDQRFAIQFSRVLDLGVGYSHWSEQWQKQFGGEIHSLLATRPLFQQERYNLTQYRFLNGPVIDGDAFNDGTINFYMLVQLGSDSSEQVDLRQRYAIVWIDEQTYFTQRWRLLHPTDDVLGDLFSLSHSLKDHPEWFNFELDKFWCPFQADLINDSSRMAVRRQIVAVTGFSEVEARWEIYTICFNYGVCDHSSRWRLFPQGEQMVIESAKAQDAEPELPPVALNGPADSYVMVNTLDLRDDTTLHVRGTKRVNSAQDLVQGRWVQRYLPADCRHFPPPRQLQGGKPTEGFHHGWDFVSEPAYRRGDRFYHFGVYEEGGDSRCQYYEVELLPDEDGQLPNVDDIVGRVWRNDADAAGKDVLKINTSNFVWSLDKDEQGAIAVGPTKQVMDRRDLPTMSMYEKTTRFRLFERKPLGLIASYYDKRDDELQSASDLPQETVLVEDFEDSSIPKEWEMEQGGEAKSLEAKAESARRIRVLFKANKRVMRPPVVPKAKIIRDKAPGLRTLHISFWTPQSEDQVYENIWKVSLAAVDDAGVVPFFSLPVFPNFARRTVPHSPLPYDFDGELGDAYRYDFSWKFEKKLDKLISRFCSAAGHVDYGTSLWFEDVVGHRSVADTLVFG